MKRVGPIKKVKIEAFGSRVSTSQQTKNYPIPTYLLGEYKNRKTYLTIDDGNYYIFLYEHGNGCRKIETGHRYNNYKVKTE